MILLFLLIFLLFTFLPSFPFPAPVLAPSYRVALSPLPTLTAPQRTVPNVPLQQTLQRRGRRQSLQEDALLRGLRGGPALAGE